MPDISNVNKNPVTVQPSQGSSTRPSVMLRAFAALLGSMSPKEVSISLNVQRMQIDDDMSEPVRKDMNAVDLVKTPAATDSTSLSEWQTENSRRQLSITGYQQKLQHFTQKQKIDSTTASAGLQSFTNTMTQVKALLDAQNQTNQSITSIGNNRS